MDFARNELYLTGPDARIFRISAGVRQQLIRLPSRPDSANIRHLVTPDRKLYVLHENGGSISLVEGIDEQPTCVKLITAAPAVLSRLAISQDGCIYASDQ